MKARNDEQLNRVLPRVETEADFGLTAAQAKERLENGYGNVTPGSASRTVGQIIVSNVCTYFNLIFTILAILILIVGSYNDLMFVPIIIINTLIGIVQEIRSKRMTDKLNLMTAPKAHLIRDGAEISVPVEEAVRDDVALFRPGSQIYADGLVLEGECQVNESMVTGEADEIAKKPGDMLLSGSFVVSGQCAARLEKVGGDSFAAKLTNEAKKNRKRKTSEMLRSLNRLLTVIGILIIPMGVVMYLQQTKILGSDVKHAVVSTVGALIGMIPEGLFLLVSVALVVSVMRLAKRRTLVHEMGCIESLARVDVLCVDKTGTITEPKMTVEDMVLLDAERYDEQDVRALMNDYVGAMGTDNETMAAMQRYFSGEIRRKAAKVQTFTSVLKYSGVTFTGGATFVVGAPELIMREDYGAIRERVDKYSSLGCRVVLLARYGGELDGRPLTGYTEPIALVLLTNKIREEAPATFDFFRKQGVKIVVISGDNPVTVSRVAVEAGIENADRYVDASALNTERKLMRSVQDTVVFGRVTPEKKRKLILALKKQGHTVAMTGDGVNDILAMKEADCSVAMASGSEVASQVATIVLMDNRFSSMPSVVMEGRRVINNIERSAALFLVKNVFSFILALTALALTMGYPLSPSQLSLVNMTTIGIPSFVLAMEFSREMVRGRFLRSVLLRAFPGGVTDFAVVLAAMFICRALKYEPAVMGTMAAVLMAFVGFLMVFHTCRPFNALRTVLLVFVVLLFVGCALILPGLFSLVPLPGKAAWIAVGLMAASVPLFLLLQLLSYALGAKRPPKLDTEKVRRAAGKMKRAPKQKVPDVPGYEEEDGEES